VIVFLALVATWAIAEGALAAPDRPVPGTLALPTGLTLLASHVVGLVDHRAGSPATLAIGATWLAAGIGLRLWAIVTLGDGFATRLRPARISSRGPYRWMRHPSELGLVLAASGGAVLLASPLALIVAGLLLPLVVVRCHRENAWLP